MSTSPRIKALAKYLRDDGNDVGESDFRLNNYDKMLVEDGPREYIVCSDKEADKRVADYIKDSVWAFNVTFIASHSKIDYDETLDIVKAIQDKCEGANAGITALIKNMKKFIADAVSADGRGHFLSHYDGEENEVMVGGKRWYIYRTN